MVSSLLNTEDFLIMTGMEAWIMYIFDIAGTVIFAITGAIRGVRLKLDLLGVVVFACCVGVGGGMLRDTIIGDTPVAALENETYLISCIITGIIVFMFAGYFQKDGTLIMILDAFGLGVFTAIGAAKGLHAGLHVIGVTLMGVFTSCGGGVIRDVLARQVPAVLTSDFYATASLIGGLLYWALEQGTSLGLFPKFMIITVVVTGIRMAAIHFKVRLPVANTRT